MEIKEILQEYKNKCGFSNDYLAKEIGVSKSAVSKWLSGDVKKLKPETMQRISELLGYDIKPLLEGSIIEFKKPILGYVKAGYDLFHEENYLGYEEVTACENRKGDYFLKVVGDSMIGDGIMDGDLAYIESCQDVPSNTIAVISIADEITIKRLIKKDDMLILESSNQSVPSRYFTAQEVNELPVKVIGRVLYSKTIF